MSCVPCHVACVMCHVSCVMCHVSHVTCHVSPVTCHMPPVPCHLSLSQQPQPQTLPLLTLPLCTVGWNEKLKQEKKMDFEKKNSNFFVSFIKRALKSWMTDRKIIFTPTIEEPKISHALAASSVFNLILCLTKLFFCLFLCVWKFALKSTKLGGTRGTCCHPNF